MSGPLIWVVHDGGDILAVFSNRPAAQDFVLIYIPCVVEPVRVSDTVAEAARQWDQLTDGPET